MGFGQTRCIANHPRCATCKVREWCPVGRKRVKGENNEIAKEVAAKEQDKETQETVEDKVLKSDAEEPQEPQEPQELTTATTDPSKRPKLRTRRGADKSKQQQQQQSQEQSLDMSAVADEQPRAMMTRSHKRRAENSK